MIMATAKCAGYRHPEFVLEADTSRVPPSYLEDAAHTIEKMVASGSVFNPGQTFQIGWMITQVQARDDSRLTLQEPDMHAMPIRWVAGITETLRQMMVQLFALDSVSLRSQMNFPSVRHALLVCSHYDDAGFFMERFPPSETNPADTGWYIGCTRNDHDHNDSQNLRMVSVYEAFLRQPRICGFMAFPSGSQIIMAQGQELVIRRNGAKLSIVPGSYLAELQKK
jgi:hypothetical protein